MRAFWEKKKEIIIVKLQKIKILEVELKITSNFRRVKCNFFLKKKLLFKINKSRNISIKNNSNQSEEDDGHWLALAWGGVDGGDGGTTPYKVDETD
jgi:hypothetical protein